MQAQHRNKTNLVPQNDAQIVAEGQYTRAVGYKEISVSLKIEFAR